MLRAHTGVPGSGKSIMMIDAIEFNPAYRDRNIYAHAIEGWDRATMIQCRHIGCRTCRKLTAAEKAVMPYVEDWQEWAEAGALICIDEAHYPFPSRRERDTPLYIQRMTESRHDGVDMWLCTININMLDINVRRLIEQHVHFVAGQLVRKRITHTEVMENDQALKFGTTEIFRLPKRTFGKYKSADLHTSLQKSPPRRMLRVYIAAGLILPALYWVYTMGQDMRRSGVDPVVDTPVAAAPAGPLRMGSARESVGSNSRAVFFEQYAIADLEPRVAGIPGSSPAYDLAEMPKVTPPRIAGCIAKEQVCVCYSDQATVLEVERLVCLEWTKSPKFDPFVDPNTYWGQGKGRSGGSSAPPLPATTDKAS